MFYSFLQNSTWRSQAKGNDSRKYGQKLIKRKTIKKRKNETKFKNNIANVRKDHTEGEIMVKIHRIRENDTR